MNKLLGKAGLILMTCTFAAACGGDSTTAGDTGVSTDTGVTRDAGTADTGTADTGTPDTGTADTGTADTGTPDTGTADAGTADTGTPDTGTPDTGTPDTGTPDTGTPDAGTPDTGTPDAETDGGTPDAGTDGGMPDAGTSADGIATARGTPDGTTSLPITGVVVTYVKPIAASETEGFFVQSTQTGPALYIDVAGTGVAVGDEINFMITEMGTSATQRRAVAIGSLVTVTNGNNVAMLRQDVSAATDLVSGLDGYESEALTITASIAAFGFAGTGHDAAVLFTAGSSDSALRLRIPTTLKDSLGLEDGCDITFNANMWRFNSTAQPSAWRAADFTAVTCPAAVLSSVTTSSVTEILLVFSRAIDPTSLSSVPTQITFDNGLTAASAVVNGNEVVVTTTPQTSNLAYVVTVATSVTDVFGTGIDATGNTGMFNGFGVNEVSCDDGVDNDVDTFVDCLDTDCAGSMACIFPAITIWELDADQSGSDTAEFIEVRNTSAGMVNLSSYYLITMNGSDNLSYNAVALTGMLASGDLFIVGASGVPGVDVTLSNNWLQNGADGALIVQCPTCTDPAVDFPNDTEVTDVATFTTVTGHAVTKIDGIGYGTGDSDDAALMVKLGVTVQYNDTGTESLQRTSATGFANTAPSPDATGVQP